jgi:hypothetical protein
LAASGFTASDLRLGGPSDGVCLSRAAVRHLGSSPTAGSLFWVFFASVFFVFFFCFSSLSLLVFGSNFMGLFVG